MKAPQDQDRTWLHPKAGRKGKSFNLNKLFPRLTIRAKLAIAFAFIALLPLLLVAALGTRSALGHLQNQASQTLQHDLELARIQTQRSLREVEQHLSYLRAMGLEASLRSDLPEPPEDLEARIALYLHQDSSALFRVKAIDRTGRIRVSVRRQNYVPSPSGEDFGEEPYYVWAGSSLGPDARAFLPVEFQTLASEGASPKLIPAITVIVPIHDPSSRYQGVVVGEAVASALFAALESASPGLEGTTGLVDGEGHFLYHSIRKNDWSSLLQVGPVGGLLDDYPSDVASRLLSGGDGIVRTGRGELLSYRAIATGHPAKNHLVLYRAVPLKSVSASVHGFLMVAALAGGGVLLLVLGSSVLAADQITRPIYRLRESMGRLARGKPDWDLLVETNDELEDLARDFSVMAGALEEHRKNLEGLVSSRTAELDQIRTELSQIVEHSADAIVGLDPSGKVRLWNGGAQKLFGYAPWEAVGRTLNELIPHPGGRNRQEEAFIEEALATRGAVVGFETRRCDKGGTPLPVSITQSRMKDEQGVTVGSSLIIRDNRARETFHAQIRQSERMAAVSLMAAGLAHELNNPLSVIGNRIEVMIRDSRAKGFDSELVEDLEVLRRHVHRLGSLTGDLLAFARDDKHSAGRVDLNEAVQRMARLLESLFASSGLRLEVELDESLPPAFGEESAVETVLVNLLLNAQQATPPSGRVSIGTVGDHEGGYVHVKIQDTGPGVPASIRNRIFEPFYTTKGSGGGTGLGLAVCQTLMDRYSGRILLLDSEDGVGATFCACFPIYRASGHV